MSKPIFICPKGHYSFVSPELFSIHHGDIVIRCSVCQESTIVHCDLAVTDNAKPERTDSSPIGEDHRPSPRAESTHTTFK
ncbi:hypothetical protein [Alicyclobacillus sp. ALC3]|uniref:hypothetical protein n=1 Tax=Alicyclobacillus sp. ALC3 TaxID=2796143 RepID=UPI0019D4A560|nr:hypothetical protein [Alicyclobacillus sp. ALC3]QSO53127.1 hypothetical protein JZ785_04350 [Alicyclobacillus curvatus]WDL96468.1 hypothetical protein JC200_19440 [Alicyclobacillus sp. ALC3]